MSRCGASSWLRQIGRRSLVTLGAWVVALGLLSTGARGEDPWPFWGRTATRLGNTQTIGPQTPTIAWSVRIDSSGLYELNEASPVMDELGRIFVGHIFGATAVDSNAQEVLWEFDESFGPQWGPCVWNGYVLWGDALFETFYCVSAETGQEVWREEERFVITSPLVRPDPMGDVVYVGAYTAAVGDVVLARRVADGAEVWTSSLDRTIHCSPSVDGTTLLCVGEFKYLTALNPISGDWRWTFETLAGNPLMGLAPIVGDRVYLASDNDRYLWCVDADSGEEHWRFWTEQVNRGAVAVSGDGQTIYSATNGNVGILFAVSWDEGEELWRFVSPGLVFNPPIVAGDGTVYFCAQKSGVPYRGWVHAIRPDGSELWTKQMPDAVTASPMLAPDGTLYVVCKDKYLYALRDPPGDLDFDGDIDFDDFTSFETCMTGPREPGTAALTAPGCELLDFDSDWDVDLADVARFQLAFTGD